MTDLKEKTIKDFGDQWLSYRDNPSYYGSTDLLEDIFGPLFDLSKLNGLRVADIGSGTGRIVNMLLAAGAVHVVAVEPSAAISVLKENTAPNCEQITYVNASGENLPAGLALDFIVSIGVLHHIPDPTPVINAAYQTLRVGGSLLIWIYGREGNEKYLRFVEPLRKLTTRLPHSVLVSLTGMISIILDAYIAACRILPLPMRDYMRAVLAKFPKSVRRLTIYDQLNPAYAKYYTRSEAEQLLLSAGFQNIQSYHRHGYSWTVIGQKC